jgi:nitrite reductase/ring-hydroxylating ferredoxin subunit
MNVSNKIDDNDDYVFAAKLSDVRSAAGGYLSVQIRKHTIALFHYDSKVYALENRCPHMGFPLNRGTVKDRILTCHWHHARFDVMSGGTFDQWTGDVPSFPVQIRNENEVWIDISHSSIDPASYYQLLLQNGLKQNISLMIAKAVIAMLNEDNKQEEKDDTNLKKAFHVGLDFGSHYKESGWSQGLTIHTCMMNILPYLNEEEGEGERERAYALYHGLSAVAQDCASNPPRFEVSPLPQPWPDLFVLKQWFRKFIELRDAQAAERCIVTAVKVGANNQQIADMLFTAATDHCYLDVGHTLDFTNKALESLDVVGWDNKEIVASALSSLVLGYVNAERMEESNSWRHPIDLIAILEDVFNKLPTVLEGNSSRNKLEQEKWNGRDKLVAVLLDDNPQSIADALLDALNQGATEVELASSVAYAAALRIAQFHTQNEFSDWDAALHTFTFANAVHQGLLRLCTPELLRVVFDAAIRVYLNRFLNIPPASLPKPKSNPKPTENDEDKDGDNSSNSTFNYLKILLKEFPELLDKRQQVNQAGQLVADYLYNGGNPDLLLATIGKVLLREDRNFHSIQMIEAAFRQYSFLSGEHNFAARVNILVAAGRYLAAHSPTMRSQGRTFQIANQLYHGEHLFEE